MSRGPFARPHWFDNRTSHLPSADHDGTAIGWDSESGWPLDPLVDNLVLIAVNVLGWGTLALGLIGAALDWWRP